MFINMQPRFSCQPRIAVINIVRLQHNRRRPLRKIGVGRTQLYCTACCSKAAALHSAVPDRNQFQCLLIEVPAPLQVSDAEDRPYLFFKIIPVLHTSLPFFRFGYRPKIHIFILVNFLINDYNQQKSWRCFFYAPSILTNTTIQGARTA